MKKNKLLYLSALAGLTTASIYGINKTINVVANAKSTLADSNGLIYKWRFGNIFYTKQGSGRPVLLVHDLTCGSSDTEWKFIVKKYSKTNTVYTIDLLGCGRSDKPAITYTNYLYVQLITDFVKNVISHRTDVVVTGSSASFILMACFNDKTIFDRLLLINPVNPSLNTQTISKNQKLLKTLIELPVIGTLIYNLINTKRYYTKTFKENNYHNPQLIRESIVRLYYDGAHYGTMSPKHLLASSASNYTGADFTRALKEINNSIFIIGSKFESDINKTIDAYVELNSSIEASVIDNSKHLPQLERPNELLSLVKLFLI